MDGHNQDECLPCSGLQGRSVLLLTDDGDLRGRLSDTLLRTKVQVVEAGTVHAARQKLEAAFEDGTPVDVVLIDAILPDADAGSMVKWVQEHADFAEGLVVLCGKDGGPDDTGRAEGNRLLCLDRSADPVQLLRTLCVSLGLPMRVPAKAAKRIVPHERSLNVLVAEDNPLNQKLALRLLEKMGHRATLAETGKQAVEHWQSAGFDVILMDVDMPEMDGYEATEEIRLRERGSGRHVPILAMTAHVMPEVQETCMAAGMDGFLAKPVNLHELERFMAGIARKGGGQAYVDVEKNPVLYAEMAQIFLTDYPRHLSEVRSSLSVGDMTRARSSAHALKGMCMVFSAGPAADAAWEVERTVGTASCAGALAALERELAMMKAELEQRLRVAQP